MIQQFFFYKKNLPKRLSIIFPSIIFPTLIFFPGLENGRKKFSQQKVALILHCQNHGVTTGEGQAGDRHADQAAMPDRRGLALLLFQPVESLREFRCEPGTLQSGTSVDVAINAAAPAQTVHRQSAAHFSRQSAGREEK